MAITPFYTFNQSPLVQIYGLPAAERAVVQTTGRTRALLAIDAANNFATDDMAQEKVILDGESERVTVALRYGLFERLEIGMDLPLVGYNGGMFDGAIEEWHRVFLLPQGNREDASHGRLLFSYSRNEEERLRMDDSNFGIGDIRLTSGWQLYNGGGANPSALALRASLKLPTGSSAKLRGSGSTDLALWLTGSVDHPLAESWGHVALFGAAGGMALTDGEVLEDQQRNLIGFGSLGVGWSPLDWLALKTQVSGHTPFYQGSDLNQLSSVAAQLLFGAGFALSARTALDIALSEDISVTTNPDVALHVGLSHQF